MNKATVYVGRYVPHWLTLPTLKFLQAPPAEKNRS
jgi:hypothetical protein